VLTSARLTVLEQVRLSFPARKLFARPLYTWMLCSAVVGEIPSASRLPSGCIVHPRCPFGTDACTRTEPDLLSVGPAPVARRTGFPS